MICKNDIVIIGEVAPNTNIGYISVYLDLPEAV